MKRAFKWAGIVAGGDSCSCWRWQPARSTCVLRNTVPAPSGSLAIAGLAEPVELVRDREARAAHLRQDHRRPLRRAGLRPRAGPAVADGAAAAHRPGPPVGDLRRAHLRHRRVPAHARSVRPRGALASPPCRPRPGARSRPTRAASTPSSTRSTGWLEPRLPPEFLLLRHRPEPWQPADSVVISQADGAAALDQPQPRDCCGWRSPPRA